MDIEERLGATVSTPTVGVGGRGVTRARRAEPEGAKSEVMTTDTFVWRRCKDNDMGGRRKGEAHVAFIL
jgi:hypothetical protein